MLADRQPVELLVHDATEPCPYLPEQQARMPLRLPIRPLTPAEMDHRLARGDRRHGSFFYRPSCGDCDSCQAIRLPADYALSSTQRRVLRKGDRELRVEIGPPIADERRIELYDRHRFGRGLARDGSSPMELMSYQRFLVDRLCDAFELRYHHGDALIGVAIVDRAASSLSAVYCYYDPAFSGLSIGTYSVLKQLELVRRWEMKHLYLGLYIEGCDAMAYKAKYLPHERRIDGEWVPFEKG